MAVNDKGNTPNQNQHQQQRTNGQADQSSKIHNREPDLGSHGTEQPRNMAGAGIGNINDLFKRSGRYDRSDQRTAEALNSLTKMREDAVQQQLLANDFDIISFDRDANSVGISSVLITKSFDLGGTRHVIVRALMLDSKEVVDVIRPRSAQYNNDRFETKTLPGDVYNDLYWNRITAMITQREGAGGNIAVFDAGAMLIPREFDFEDRRDVAKVLVSSVNRCDDVGQKLRKEPPFNAAQVKNKDERLLAVIDTHGETQYTLTGMPVRSDMVVKLRRQSTNATQDPNDYYERDNEFNSVSLYTSLEYDPEPASFQGTWGGQPQQAQPTQLFTPAIVITQVQQADWIQAMTPEMFLLALSNAFRITANSAWITSLLPRKGVDGIDLRDIGVLGYLTEMAKHLDVKSDSVGDGEIMKFLQSMVRENPSFLYDVDLMGDHSLIDSFLLDAAGNGPNAAQANRMLFEAADNLTDGAFSRCLPQNVGSFTIDYGQEITAGYWGERNNGGEKRDIRELDALGVLALSNGDHEQFIEWVRTLQDTNMPAEQRLIKREAMERNMLDSNMRVTGRYQRLAINPGVLQALYEATEAAGVAVAYNDVAYNLGGRSFQGNSQIRNFSVNGQAKMGYGGNNQNYQAGVQIPAGRRYY